MSQVAIRLFSECGIGGLGGQIFVSEVVTEVLGILRRGEVRFYWLDRWCRGGELNSLRRPFQGRALPVSYPGISVDKRLYGRRRLGARALEHAVESSFERELKGERAHSVPKSTGRSSRYKTATPIRSWFCSGLPFLGRAVLRCHRNSNECTTRKCPHSFPGYNAKVQIEPPAGTLAAP
jgi:hypothetical protein